MKKALALLLSAALLVGMLCSAGAFTVSAEESDETVYSVIGNSENIFYNTYDEYDETTEMTYDPRVGLYKLIIYDVQPEQDVEIYIVKNHSIYEGLRQGYDAYSTYFIFDVVSPCDILITFDAENNIVDVLGEGVVPFNAREVYLIANGSNAFLDETQNYEKNRVIEMTEVESKVWETTVDNVLVSSQPYCYAGFEVNRYWYEYQSGDKTYGYYKYRFGIGQENYGVTGSGVETSAAVNKSIGIAFKVEQNFSTVKFRLDLRNFDYKTRKGAKFTVTVIPPEKETDFSLLYVDENDEPYAPDSEIPMEYNPETGLYGLSVTDNFPSTDCRFYVLKNHGEDGKYGDPETGESYYYDVNKGKDIDITFDPLTDKINIIGYGVLNKKSFKVNNVTAASNINGSLVNGNDWETYMTWLNNQMTETSPGVWEITYNDVPANDNYRVKFALNHTAFETEPWQFYFGAISEDFYNTNEEQAIVRNGKDICFKVDKNHSRVTLKLDLRDFSFRNRKDQVAKLTINVEPENIIKFKDSDEDILMTLNEETGLYEYKTYYFETTYGQEFYIYGKDKVFGDPNSDEMYYFDVLVPGYVTITFDPVTEQIGVTGNKNIVQTAESFEIKTITAVGNGYGAWLNGAEWDVSATSNNLTETSEGIWEISYEDVMTDDLYRVKFAANSCDHDIHSCYFFGTENVAVFYNGVEVNAPVTRSNFLAEVEEDGSTVHLKLDLRNFDFKTKQGAKVTITVTPPEAEPEWTAEPTIEPTAEGPVYAILGDVNGDNIVDILDAVLVQKYSADKTGFSQEQIEVADFNGDGNVDILDATAIQKYAASA